ncbi:hypothetical protein GCM10010116_11730 [Microbispora rosea subsp. aerata]|nr:hypothetical protein [Microbispora rosea]GGO05968.1 hypothetical protein GCM10010116_11730 [Microbispora rosea subsp. aerata]GIH55218.1 hypothetical protein Mro02_21320 [Microbispora rosea subsp. aerata]GLJ82668.1 hypothetical protein GCM10017588_13930 [Microbispora rosea subsp. aerata]
MLDELVARYNDLLADLDAIAYTVTIPDTGVLTIDDAVRRLGFEPAAVLGPGQPCPPDSISLYQVGTGLVTLGWYAHYKEVTDRLAGEGFRHWYLSYDIEGNTSLYVRYGEAEGSLEHPEPIDIPFTDWRDLLGPLSPYTELLASGYDSEEEEARVDMTAAALAVIEAESGVRLDKELMDSPHSALLIPSISD